MLSLQETIIQKRNERQAIKSAFLAAHDAFINAPEHASEDELLKLKGEYLRLLSTMRVRKINAP